LDYGRRLEEAAPFGGDGVTREVLTCNPKWECIPRPANCPKEMRERD
jgi:hypothetical protein